MMKKMPVRNEINVNEIIDNIKKILNIMDENQSVFEKYTKSTPDKNSETEDNVKISISLIYFLKSILDHNLKQLIKDHSKSQILNPSFHKMLSDIWNEDFQSIQEKLKAYPLDFLEESMDGYIDIDTYVLGEAYETLVSDKFRKGTGEFYTSQSIVSYILNEVINVPNEQKSVLDPSSGVGTFNLHLLKKVVDASDTEGFLAFMKNVHSYEINPFTKNLQMLQIMIYITNYQKELLFSDIEIKHNIYCKDALMQDSNEEFRLFDIVIGNPPYIRAERVKNSIELKENFGEIWGQNSDTAILFTYKSLVEWLKPNGKLGFVLPGSIANSQAASKLRSMFKHTFTIQKIVWLEFPSNVWEANSIPLIIIGEKRKPKKNDFIEISHPNIWPVENLSYEKIPYFDYFNDDINVDNYILPLLKKDDLPILRRVYQECSDKMIKDEISFKYGIQRGKNASLETTAGIGNFVKVVDGKNISMNFHGESVGFVNLDKVQKKSLWSAYKQEEEQLDLFAFANQQVEYPSNGYIALPGIILAPTATYIEDGHLAALDTCIVGHCESKKKMKAICLYLNTELSKFITLIYLRAGVMAGSHRLHMYPRTIESLPWIENEEIINQLADIWDKLNHEASLLSVHKEACLDKWQQYRQKSDLLIYDLFHISIDEQAYIHTRLAEFPLNTMESRLPWNTSKKKKPAIYKPNRYEITVNEATQKWEPLKGCVSTLKSNDALFLNTHPYHTKVPPSIVKQHIEHYTKDGDTVLDSFAGSGMTGIAALDLGRNVILNDLSPAAVHIEKGYTEKIDLNTLKAFKSKFDDLLPAINDELYKTTCDRCNGEAKVAYMIWSDVCKCSNCSEELNLWEVSVDSVTGKVNQKFECPSCHNKLTRKDISSLKVKAVPVVTVYDCMEGCSPTRFEHKTKAHEIKFLKQFSYKDLPNSVPIVPMMHEKAGEKWGEQYRVGYHMDVTHVHHFFTPRTNASLAKLYDLIQLELNPAVRQKLMFGFTATLFAASKMVKYIPSRGGRSNVPGTLYIPALSLEQNVFSVFSRRLEKVIRTAEWRTNRPEHLTDQVLNLSAKSLYTLKNNSVDYIFTDPPFGSSLQYAELNFIYEAWLKQYTKIDEEIVINNHRNQDHHRYFDLLEDSFSEMYRVLKPGKYASVVFNNTEPEIWISFQNAIIHSGFSIVGVAMIDKGKASWNQATNSDGTARYDVVVQLQKEKQIIPSDRVLPYTSKEDVEALLVQFLRNLQVKICKERTTPYLHSLAIQHLLTHKFDFSPPKPGDIEEILENQCFKNDGYWFV